MTDESDLTTAEDPNRRRHQVMLMGLVWLSVYPLVTIGSYLVAALDLPTWAETFLTTLATVPIITFLVVPNAKWAIAKGDPKA